MRNRNMKKKYRDEVYIPMIIKIRDSLRYTMKEIDNMDDTIKRRIKFLLDELNRVIGENV